MEVRLIKSNRRHLIIFAVIFSFFFDSPPVYVIHKTDAYTGTRVYVDLSMRVSVSV